MIGKLNTQDKRVTVVGAGISGLLIAYTLKKKGYQVSIHEKSNRCGGLIQTKHTPYGMAETAAHSLLVNEVVENFVNELGIELLPVNPKSNARYIYRDGKMRKMPLTFAEILSTLFHVFKKPTLPAPLQTLNLEQWGNAYLGPAATRYLLGPFTTGIFACSPAELNAKLSFPKLIPSSENVSLFRHLLSSKKQKSKRARIMVFKNGTEELVQKLQAVLKNEIHLNSEISSVDQIEGNLILSVPSPALENLLKATTPSFAEKTSTPRYSPLITITVFYSHDSFDQLPKGIGVLIPAGEGMRILGCLFNSSAFSERTKCKNDVSLTVMLGGTKDPDILGFTDSQISGLIADELSILLKAKKPPLHLEITRWQRAVPIYSTELSLYIDSLSSSFCSKPGKIIFSNFTGQVSIRGMIESTHQL